MWLWCVGRRSEQAQMIEEPTHIALAKARILSDVRYLNEWRAVMIRIIVKADSVGEALKKILEAK